MDFGDPDYPLNYEENVLRKAKQEYKDKEYGDLLKSDVFTSLVQMKHTEPYSGWIQFIAIDSVMVFYSVPAQYVIYKYCAKTGYIRISIDATGSIIRRCIRGTNFSGHIFLYEIVINTGTVQMPIFQMVSERQDANAILFWLFDWRRGGAPIPNETVCDGSKALLNAAARGIAECKDLKEYKRICFSVASGESDALPSTFLRMDVAHVIKSVCRWDVWKSAKRVKDFYVRCFVAALHSENLKTFRHIYLQILILTFSKNNGHIGSVPTAAEKSYTILAEEISQIGGR